MELKELFKGKQLLKTIGLIIYSAIYVLLFIIMAFPKYALNILLTFAFFLMGYWVFYERFTKKKQLEVKGIEVIGGWIEHYQAVGEPFHLYVSDIQPIEKLSETDIMAVDEFVADLVEKAKARIKVDIGEGQFENKEEQLLQLTYQEIDETDKQFIERMKEEYKKFKQQKKNELTNNTIEGENEEEVANDK